MLPYARHLAQTSKGGKRVRSENAFCRNDRQRRRAFKKEAGKLIRSFELRFPDFPKPRDGAERDAMCAQHSHFAEFCEKLDTLASRYGQ